MILLAATASITLSMTASELTDSTTTEYITTKISSLPEIQVKGRRPMFRMIGGDLLTQIKGTPLEKENTLDDILRRIPGFVKGQTGKLEVFGLGQPLIYINGRKATETEIEKLDVKQIKNIKLVTSPGAKYDAEAGAVVEIATVNRDEGLFGCLKAWDKVSNQNSWNGNATLGWTTKRTNITADYGYTDYRYNVTQPQSTIIHKSEGDYIYQANREGSDKHKIHSASASIDYQLTDNHVIGAQWEGNWASGGRHEWSTQQYQYPSEANRSFFADGKEDATSNDHHVNIFHRATWNERLSTALYLDYAKDKSDMTQPVVETEDNTTATIDNTSRTDYDVYSGRLTADITLSQVHSLSLGAEASVIDGNGGMTSTAQDISDEDYANREEKIAAYAQYNGATGAWSWNAGLRYEHLHSKYSDLTDKANDMDKRYDQLFPSIGVSFSGEHWKHSLQVNTRTSRPTLASMSSATYFVNRFFYQKGNPQLQPATMVNARWQSAWKDFTLTLSYRHTSDIIAYDWAVPNSQPVRLVATFKNYDNYSTASASLSWNHAFGIWRPSVNANFRRQFFSVDYMGSNLNLDGNMWTLSTNHYLTLKSGWQFSLYYYHSFGGKQLYTDFEPNQEFRLSLSKSFLSDRLSVSLEGSDLFRQSIYREKQKVGIVDFSQTEDYHERNVRLTLTYRFNHRKSKYRGENSAETEINRL